MRAPKAHDKLLKEIDSLQTRIKKMQDDLMNLCEDNVEMRNAIREYFDTICLTF